MVIRCNAGLKCPAQRTARTTHFASKKALDIRGLAEKQIEKLFETNAIERTSDIFTLEERFYGPNRRGGRNASCLGALRKPRAKEKARVYEKRAEHVRCHQRRENERRSAGKIHIRFRNTVRRREATKELAKTYKSLDKFKEAAERYHETGSSVDDEESDVDEKNGIKISLEAVEGVGDIVAKSIANFLERAEQRQRGETNSGQWREDSSRFWRRRVIILILFVKNKTTTTTTTTTTTNSPI